MASSAPTDRTAMTTTASPTLKQLPTWSPVDAGLAVQSSSGPTTSRPRSPSGAIQATDGAANDSIGATPIHIHQHLWDTGVALVWGVWGGVAAAWLGVG